jgi:CRP-like cAMP-binding protein
MLPVPDAAAFQERLARLPTIKYQGGEVVLTAGSSTRRLLVLRSGAVEVIKDGVQIANISAPGAVFGDLAALLAQPHTADVRSRGKSEFFVADAPTLLAGDPTVLLYVAAVLARRLDAANSALVDVKRQLRAGEPRSTIGKTVETVQELLSSDGGPNLLYAGYPYDPCVTH